MPFPEVYTPYFDANAKALWNCAHASTPEHTYGSIGDCPSLDIDASASPPEGGAVACTPDLVGDGGQSTCTATPNAGYTFANWGGGCAGSTRTCTLDNITESQTVTANFNVAEITGDSPTGNGSISIAVAEDGAGLSAASFIPIPADAPSWVRFPYGMVDFTVHGTGTATVTLTYPDTLPAGATYWKRQGNTYTGYPATIKGNTVTFTLTDNGAGDDDPAIGVVHDPGGVGVAGTRGDGSGSTGGGGGSADGLGLLALLPLALVRLFRRKASILKQGWAWLPLVGALVGGLPVQAGSLPQGMYVGASMGTSKGGAGTSSLVTGPARCGVAGAQCTAGTGNTSWGVFVGRQLSGKLAVEVEYADLGKVLDGSVPQGGVSDHYSQRVRGLGLSLVGKAQPLAGKPLSLYGKAGLSHWASKAAGSFSPAVTGLGTGVSRKESGDSPVLGVGLEYAMSPHWSLRAGWDRHFKVGERGVMLDEATSGWHTQDAGVDVYSASVAYHF